MMTVGSTNTIHYGIDHEGTLMCVQSTGDGNSYDKSSCLATIHMQQGDTAFVKMIDDSHAGHHVLHGYWSSFSGFLISEDI